MMMMMIMGALSEHIQVPFVTRILSVTRPSPPRDGPETCRLLNDCAAVAEDG